MSNETKIEGVALLAGEQSIKALIETQTILQLLVKKKIVTPEEVKITRNIVKNQPQYSQVLRELNNALDNLEKSKKFEELMEKQLQGENLTSDERNFLLNQLG